MGPEDRTDHLCYAFLALHTTRGREMRWDLLIILVGILLLVAMVLTLLYGREYSRHGYGWAPPHPSSPLGPCPASGSQGSLPAPVVVASWPPTQDRVTSLRPGVDPTVQIIKFRVPPPGQIINDLGAA